MDANPLPPPEMHWCNKFDTEIDDTSIFEKAENFVQLPPLR